VERQKYLKTLHKLQSDLEEKQSNFAVIKLRTGSVEQSLKARKEQIMRWKYTAQEILEEEDAYSDDEEQDEEDVKAAPNLDAMAVQVSKASFSLLDHYLQFFRFNHIINLEGGDNISESELQYIMQLSCEIVANVLQADSVYVAEYIHNQEKGGALQFLKTESAVLEGGDKASDDSDIFVDSADFLFMYVAATSSNNFLVGSKLPSSSLTHKHFVENAGTDPLHVDLASHWDQTYFHSKELPADRDGQYISVPLFDLRGTVCGFLAVDTLRSVRGQPKPDLFEPWRIEMIQSVCDCISRALAQSKGLADDIEEMHGPVYFAKRTVEIIAGRSADNFDDVDPPFLHTFPLLSELSKRGNNVFGSFTADLPRKRYFSGDDEFTHEQLSDIKEVRLSLQEAIFLESRNKKEIKLMCSSSVPPPETLKVWRTIIVILGLQGDEVLNTDQNVAWEQIRYMLSDDRPAKERIYALIKDFDPSASKALDKSADARYNLATGLLQTVRSKNLLREGPLSVLLYEWTLCVQYTRSLALSAKGG